MHITNLRKVGGSVMMAVPPAFLDMFHIQAGSKVGLLVEDGRLVVDLHPRPRYRLHDLLAQCDSMAELSAEDHDWVNENPFGDELI